MMFALYLFIGVIVSSSIYVYIRSTEADMDDEAFMGLVLLVILGVFFWPFIMIIALGVFVVCGWFMGLEYITERINK